ncbi:hypothetical protein GCM10027049_25630 [Mucilaginibacter puniceus]
MVQFIILKKDFDRNRDTVLSALGLTVLRFSNDEILKNTQMVLKEIKQELIKHPL